MADLTRQGTFNDERSGYASIVVRTVWLASGDYPLLLGCSDVGVSMHGSTSGLDLPMKVVDLFGAGTPAIALRFPCIDELVCDAYTSPKQGTALSNGLTFSDASGLCDALTDALASFPDAVLLRKLTEGAGALEHWEDNWDRVALPLIVDLVS